jgi:hypothetical protein
MYVCGGGGQPALIKGTLTVLPRSRQSSCQYAHTSRHYLVAPICPLSHLLPSAKNGTICNTKPSQQNLLLPFKILRMFLTDYCLSSKNTNEHIKGTVHRSGNHNFLCRHFFRQKKQQNTKGKPVKQLCVYGTVVY